MIAIFRGLVVFLFRQENGLLSTGLCWFPGKTTTRFLPAPKGARIARETDGLGWSLGVTAILEAFHAQYMSTPNYLPLNAARGEINTADTKETAHSGVQWKQY